MPSVLLHVPAPRSLSKELRLFSYYCFPGVTTVFSVVKPREPNTALFRLQPSLSEAPEDHSIERQLGGYGRAQALRLVHRRVGAVEELVQRGRAGSEGRDPD
jgi:hypothetical protein